MSATQFLSGLPITTVKELSRSRKRWSRKKTTKRSVKQPTTKEQI